MGDHKTRGRITVDYWVACGDCYDHAPLADVRRLGSATANAKAEGWKFTKRWGWLCPACQEKHAKANPR